MKRLVEIRSYKLKVGATSAFHDAFVTAGVPLLREWGTDVVAFGPSPHEADAYYLIRSYASLDDLQARPGCLLWLERVAQRTSRIHCVVD